MAKPGKSGDAKPRVLRGSPGCRENETKNHRNYIENNLHNRAEK
jgi:hypothetical protein